MYKYDIIEKAKKDDLSLILSNKELFPFVEGDNILFRYKDKDFFKKKIIDFGINDLSDILGISIVDSTYVYYLLDIACCNSIFEKCYCKKKSLGL